ncbi:MAG: sulfatase [Nocardioides sp.]
MISALLTSVLTGAGAALAPDPRPNIVLITTDDQTIQDMSWLPKTRAALATAGVTFSTTLSPHPLCCPARAEILTGQYAQNNGVYSNSGATGGYAALREPDNTLPAWVQSAGYRTGFVGKFLNGYSWEAHGTPAGWDLWDPTILGTYSYYGYTTANNGEPRLAPEGEYITDYVATTSRDLITRWAPLDKPFFLWSSYVAPHRACPTSEDCSRPPIPEADYLEAYATAVNYAAAKPSFNERNVKDKPKRIRNRPKDPAKMQELFLGRIRSLASVDDAVADTVAALTEAGVLDNTVIIFTSDNGYLLGEHRQEGKRKAYEESLRVPLIIRGPGFGAGQVATQVATLVDLTPTIIQVSQASAGRVADGRSLLGAQTPVLATDRMTRLIQSGADVIGTQTRLWDWRGIRERRYTFVRWRSGFVELYDRLKDPYQLSNKADKPKYQKILKKLRKRFNVLKTCAGTTSCYRNFGPLPAPKKPPKRRRN